MDLAAFNQLDRLTAIEHLRACCAMQTWAEKMADQRPFVNIDDCLTKASELWWSLSPAEWQAAFAAHPRIGDLDALRRKYSTSAAWSAGEQASIATAGDHVLQQLAEANDAYAARYGYIFIVCATGKGADEMLAILQSRLSNNLDDELRIAAAEQEKITAIRLHKLFTPED